MRASRYLISTLKESPADAEIVSHQLMLRAGMTRKLAAGLYTWLPLGLRVLRKVEAVVRQEMDAAGAQEVLMPMVQPADLWRESGRFDEYGPELLRINDRHDREFCLGPTHEEVITDLIRGEIRSYKQLPANFYQIQTKFRDEIRPRFGIMRAREFLMKDAYSFHTDEASLRQTYDVMHRTYCNIFDRLGLDYRPVLADTGSIGGSVSHEFHVLADSGEDAIAFSTESDYAANIEKAEALAVPPATRAAEGELAEVATPNAGTIAEVCKLLEVPADHTVKTLIVHGEEPGQLVALVVRGDHELNELKAEKIEGVAAPLQFADEDTVRRQLGCGTGSLGPVGLGIAVIVDRSAAVLQGFVCGANKDGYHLTLVSWDRDCPDSRRVVDLRTVVEGDPSPDGRGQLEIRRGIEVGHIFQLGAKYSEAMNAKVLNEQGSEQTLVMGCYGIGVSRLVAAAIEQNHDDRGIIWPDAIAPFQVAIIPINAHKSEPVRKCCEEIYEDLRDAGYDVLLMDEEKARLGVMLADVELIGIPHRLVVGDRGLEKGTLEYKGRRDTDSLDIPRSQLMDFMLGKASPASEQ